MRKGSHHTQATKQKLSVSRPGWRHSEEAKRKISLARIGKKHSEFSKRKMALASTGKKHTKETKQKLSLWHKGKESYFKGKRHSLATRQRLSLSHKGQPSSMKGKHHSLEAKQKLSQALQGRRLSRETKQKMSKSYIERLRSGAIPNLKRFGNKLEQKLWLLLEELWPGRFIFNTRLYTIGLKIPDFIGTYENIAVEAFGTYWHGKARTGRSRYQEEQRRIRYFRKHGYRTVIFWEDEINKLIVDKRLTNQLTTKPTVGVSNENSKEETEETRCAV